MRRAAIGGLLLLALTIAAPPASADALSPQRQREILRDGLSAFDRAVETGRRDATAAAELYRQSAAAFETLLDAGLRNAALEYNLGNAYMRLGQTGRAILHYRRAARLAPREAKREANLEYARNRVRPFIAEQGGNKLLRSLLFLHYDTTLRLRLWGCGLASAVGWLLLLVRLRWRQAPLRAAGLTCVALGLSLAASVGWQLRGDAFRPPAVIVAGEHVLRMGKGEGADPAIREPLGAGVELNVIGTRGDWVEIRLRDGREGWLPAGAIERI